MPIILIFIFTLFCPFVVCWAAPSISGASISNGVLTISGSAFGVHSDNNSSSYSGAGLTFAWESMENGALDVSFWDKSAGSGGPLPVTDLNNRLNSGTCARFVRLYTATGWTDIFGRSWGSSTTQYGLGIDLENDGGSDPGTQQVIYMSAWMMVPANFRTNILAADPGSQIKTMGATAKQNDSSDGPKTYYSITNSGAGGTVAQNTHSEDTDPTEQVEYGNVQDLSNWTSEGTWHRFDIYIDTTQAYGVKIHNYYIDGMKVNRLNEYYVEDDCGAYDCPRNFKFLNWGFVIQWPYDDNYLWPIYMDDYLVDWTQARVEISENSTWDENTQYHKEIQVPTAWSTTEITATVNQGSFANGSSVYVFVVDSNGDASAGYGPITIGASIPTFEGTQFNGVYSQ